MSKSLADYICQDRTLLSFPRSEMDVPSEETFNISYKWEKDGIVKVHFSACLDYDTYIYSFSMYDYYHNKLLLKTSGWVRIEYIDDPAIITSKVVGDELVFYLSGINVGDIAISEIYKCFSDFEFKEEKPDVCPGCGGELDENGDCKNENCEENPNITPSPNPNDNPPCVLGYASNEIYDVKGYVGYSIPIFFRAYDDFGISKFAFCEIDEHETEGIQVIRYFKPQKIGEGAYRLNIIKELEGTYRYKIIVYDTSNQKAESNEFNLVVSPPITPPNELPTPPSVSDSEHIVLYDKNSNDFTANGIGILDNDVIYASVEKEENGVYELVLKYLVTGRYSDEIMDIDNIIKCKTDVSNSIAQLFRIYETEYVMQENIIIVKASHISYDLKNAFIENVNLVNASCNQVVQAIASRCIGNDRFVINSNIDIKSNFSQQRVNVLECIMGIEKSIFDTYGNNNIVINRDNFNYSINQKTDNDKGVVIAYGKNLLGFKRTINSNNIITGIYPYAYLRNGACLNLKEKIIYSQYKDNYPMQKIKSVDFTDETIVNEDTLREVASKYFENNCDVPIINYEVNFLNLYSNNAYLKDKFRSLEEVLLGDTVTIQDTKIGINVKARVLKTVYNILTQRYEKIQLGNFSNEYRSSKAKELNKFKNIIRDITY